MLIEHTETMLREMNVAELNKTYLCDSISLKNMWIPVSRISVLVVQSSTPVKSQMHLYAYHIKRIILENNVNTTQSREHFSAIKKRLSSI